MNRLWKRLNRLYPGKTVSIGFLLAFLVFIGNQSYRFFGHEDNLFEEKIIEPIIKWITKLDIDTTPNSEEKTKPGD